MCSSQWYSDRENYDNTVIVSYSYKIFEEERWELIQLESIEGLCFHICIGNNLYVAQPCNTIEYHE